MRKVLLKMQCGCSGPRARCGGNILSLRGPGEQHSNLTMSNVSVLSLRVKRRCQAWSGEVKEGFLEEVKSPLRPGEGGRIGEEHPGRGNSHVRGSDGREK